LNVLDQVKRSGTQCSNSNSSLPSVPSGRASGVGRVASWAVSFERLLEDPLGVHYFTEFLKSEVSVENILFWLACENFRKIPPNNIEKLTKEATSIYNSYLSKCACNPINIDDKVRVDEKDIQQPHPEIFQKAQTQIFKLMKFDSYTRFVRSHLYQKCMLANVEGRSLPELAQYTKPPLTARHSSPATRELPKSKEKAKVKFGKSAGGESDDAVERRKPGQGKMSWEKRKEKRGSWGEPQMTGRPGSFHSGEQPLSLEQDSSVLKDQQVVLELRVTFALEVVFTGKTVAMVVKASKTLQEALASLLQKHRLRPQDVCVTMKESQELVNMNTIVTNLANKTLILDKVKGLEQSLASKIPVSALQARRGAVDVDLSASGPYRSNPKQKNPVMRRAYDMEGLVELLNRTQWSNADDQRGLLRKEDLILPNFLQLPLEEPNEDEEQRSET
ncbi:regulator of G-protein signaling 14-like, partial [Clarias magur]